MNDIIIKGHILKRELTVLLICFLIAFIANIYAIIAYNTPWSELISSLGFVCIVTFILYLIIGLIRLIIKGVQKLF